MLCLVKLENLWNRIDVRRVSNKNSGLVIIRKSKVALIFNKPVYVGMCILDLSKVLMYKFDYDYIKNKYGNNWRLLFTETNNLMYEVKTEVLYEDFSKDKEIFDCSYYSPKQKIMMSQTD